MVRNVSLIVRWQQRFCHATNQNKIRLSGKTYVAFEREYSRWRSPEPLARPQDLALLLLILQHSLQGIFQFTLPLEAFEPELADGFQHSQTWLLPFLLGLVQETLVDE